MLTPEQIQQYRKQYNITPGQPSTTEPLRGQALLESIRQKSGSAPVPVEQEETLVDKIKGRGKKVVEEVNEVKEVATDKNISPGMRAVGAVAEAGQVPLKVLSQAGGAIGDVVGAGIDKIMPDVGAVENDKLKEVVGKASEQWKKFSTENPTAAEMLGDIGNLLNLTGAGELALLGKQGTKQVVKNVAEKQAARTVAKTEEAAYKALQPDFKNMTEAQRQKLLSEPDVQVKLGDEVVETVPRVQEGGFFQGRQVTLTPFEKEAAEELARVPGFSPKLSNLESHNILKREISATGDFLEDSLAAKNIVIPRKQIVSTVKQALDTLPEDSLLLQKTDPAIAQYIRVVTNAANQNDGTALGVLKVRQAMDKAYEAAGKKYPTGSDKIGALDEVHDAGRDALNQLLIGEAKRAKAVDVEKILKKETNLFRADKMLKTKAAKESGSTMSKVGGFVKDNPLVQWLIGAGLLGAGIKQLGE